MKEIIRRGSYCPVSGLKKRRAAELAGQGLSIDVVAERLGLSPNTIYPHWRKGVRHEIQTKVSIG